MEVHDADVNEKIATETQSVSKVVSQFGDIGALGWGSLDPCLGLKVTTHDFWGALMHIFYQVFEGINHYPFSGHCLGCSCNLRINL